MLVELATRMYTCISHTPLTKSSNLTMVITCLPSSYSYLAKHHARSADNKQKPASGAVHDGRGRHSRVTVKFVVLFNLNTVPSSKHSLLAVETNRSEQHRRELGERWWWCRWARRTRVSPALPLPRGDASTARWTASGMHRRTSSWCGPWTPPRCRTGTRFVDALQRRSKVLYLI
jgi:hypothetical protein